MYTSLAIVFTTQILSFVLLSIDLCIIDCARPLIIPTVFATLYTIELFPEVRGTCVTYCCSFAQFGVDFPVESHQDNGAPGDHTTVGCQYGDCNWMLAHQWSVEENGH